MTAQITSQVKTTQLTNFVNAFNEDVEEDDFKSLYVVLGKDTAWEADGAGRIETDSGFSVPPVDEDHIESFWNNALTYIRIFSSSILPVVSECTYTSGDRWFYQESNVPIGAWVGTFISTPEYKSIMRNSEGRVYKCIEEPTDGTCYIGGNATPHTSRYTCVANSGATWIPSEATMEPKGLPSEKGAEIIAGNYKWEYLWTLDPNTIIDSVNYRWQPVSYNLYTDGGICEIDGQTDMTYTTPEECNTQPLGNWMYSSIPFFEQEFYGVDPAISISDVRCMNIMIQITLNSDIIGSDITSFRQLFLVDTPYTADEEKSSASVVVPTDMSAEISGSVILLENKLPVIRSEDQRESIKLILRF